MLEGVIPLETFPLVCVTRPQCVKGPPTGCQVDFHIRRSHTKAVSTYTVVGVSEIFNILSSGSEVPTPVKLKRLSNVFIQPRNLIHCLNPLQSVLHLSHTFPLRSSPTRTKMSLLSSGCRTKFLNVFCTILCFSDFVSRYNSCK